MLPSRKAMYPLCLIIIVVSCALCAFFPGHEDGYVTLIVGTAVVYLADCMFRGKEEKQGNKGGK
jgi:hypothetical protein